MKVIHDYIREKKFKYDPEGLSHAFGLKNDSDVNKLKDLGRIDCSAYVSWVLYASGIKIGMVSSDYFYNEEYKNNKTYKWETIPKSKGESALKPGDILSRSGHVEFYRGDGTVYCAGSDSHIQDEYSSLGYWDHATRVGK